MVQVDAALLKPLRLAVLPPLVMMVVYPVVESCPLASPSTKFPLETKLVNPHPDKSFSEGFCGQVVVADLGDLAAVWWCSRSFLWW